MDDFNKKSNKQGNDLKLGDLIKQEFNIDGKLLGVGEEPIFMDLGGSNKVISSSDGESKKEKGLKTTSVWGKVPSQIFPEHEIGRKNLHAYWKMVNNPEGIKSVKNIVNTYTTKHITRDQLIKTFNIPTWEDFEKMIKPSLANYLKEFFSQPQQKLEFNTSEELLDEILNDLYTYVYGGSEAGMYNKISEQLQFLNKKTNQGLSSIKPILDFVSGEKFPFLLDEDTTNKSLIDLFAQQYMSLSDSHLLTSCWRDFNIMLRENIPLDLHKYYFAHTDIEVVPPTEMFYATSWKISYSAPYMHQKDEYEKIFNKELKSLFIKYVCRVFGVDKSGF